MRSPKIKALGEVGLDFQARHMGKQEEVLRYILRAYADPAKPVILHLRGPRGNEDVAYSRGLKLARECLDKTQPIQLHCFNGGSAAFAQWREHFPNVYASFSGLVTSFTEDQKRGLKGVPAERLLLETDAPYLPTVGKKNDNTPHHLGDVAVAVASVREEPVSEIIARANQNLCRLFRIPSA
ncbi:3'-5' ssDNA/RNA exonuclease TatD [Elysia marginata]|uniref:3'-5' ssDNA/RNA exonuclease TatD n=1 Tax=Elysia marginata TaxID=1093978 RepID=A0AAV4FD53_9GAST|nr:3'-5' ssDNA/RNA exonuclease TatD [Elysia marginata]